MQDLREVEPELFAETEKKVKELNNQRLQLRAACNEVVDRSTSVKNSKTMGNQTLFHMILPSGYPNEFDLHSIPILDSSFVRNIRPNANEISNYSIFRLRNVWDYVGCLYLKQSQIIWAC